MIDIRVAISDRRQEAEQIRRRLDEFLTRLKDIEGEIGTLEKAAPLLGIVDGMSDETPNAGADPPRTAGRKPGAIAKEWRKVLCTIYKSGNKVTFEGFRQAAKECGMEVSIKAVRQKIGDYKKAELMSGDAPGPFSVTEYAAQRFEFYDASGGTNGTNHRHGTREESTEP